MALTWTYSGDLWHRPALTGDWGGARQKLMDKGVRFNMNLTQTYQGNVAGGKINRGYYQGGLRYELGWIPATWAYGPAAC